MRITDEARDLLKQVLQEHNAAGVRIYFAGFGWNGPQLGMALDEPREEDKISIINEIQVAIEPSILEEIEGLVVEYDHRRNTIVLSGNDDCE